MTSAAVTMTPRTVVITGAGRGLGLASARHLYERGWHVIGAMRTPDTGLERIRAATGARAGDPRLTAVRLDLGDPASIAAAAGSIRDAVGAPFGLVHNAGSVSVGCTEELPFDVFEQIFTTNLFGAARLTAALLPSMRAAGRGRIVVISSEGAIHGMPAIGAYSASKGALERWAEALTLEIAPFGIGVSILVAGTFDTDVLDRDYTTSYGDPNGPYRHLHAGQARLEERIRRLASPPERFAPVLARALDEQAPFTRRAVGPDAVAMRIGRSLLPARLFQRLVSRVLRIPGPGTLRDDPIRLLPVDQPAGDPEGAT
jgi:NAD(P)-dependent dehydrogenase (short-subunit alcohol dehydrogenase family)